MRVRVLVVLMVVSYAALVWFAFIDPNVPVAVAVAAAAISTTLSWDQHTYRKDHPS